MAPPPEPPSTITLRVKVPPGHIEGGADEFTVGGDIAVTSTIGQIRERIQGLVPSNPAPERQRLLYGGRALVDNEQTLGDALNIRRDPTQKEYVVHLLIKGDGSNNAPIPRLGSATASARPANPAVPPMTTNGPRQNLPGFPQYPGLPQHLAQHQATVAAHQQRLQSQMMHNAANQGHFPDHSRRVIGGTHPRDLGAYMTPMGSTGVPFAHGPDPHDLNPHGLHPHGLHPHGLHTGIPFPGRPDTESFNGQPAVAEQTGVTQPGSTPVGSIARSENINTPSHSDGSRSEHGSHSMQDQQPPRRPISNQGFHAEGVGPNGERITIHQQTMAFQLGQQPMHATPTGFSFGLPQMPGMAPLNYNQGPRLPPSTLDQARENLAEMRQILEELRGSPITTDVQRSHLSRMEERADAINDYINPFHTGNSGNNRQRTTPQFPNSNNAADNSALPSIDQNGAATQAGTQRSSQLPGRGDVTAYLLSSPTGPRAILHSPHHGAYTGAFVPQIARPETAALHPTPTTSQHAAVSPAGADNPPHPGDPQGQLAPAPQAQQQPPAGQQDPLGPIAPVVNQMWLLLRILIFSYFLLGSNMGWRRPVALLAIGFGFWMIRMGLLGDGGGLRRWWDGIMNDGRQAAQAPQADGPAAPGQDQGPVQGQQQPVRPGQMPTPEQVAQRLIDENAQARNNRYQRLREQFRPVERAAALLVASLWPGVGEAYVRAREQEARRQAEEEVAARRREEGEKQQRDEEEKKQIEAASGQSGEEADGGEPSEPAQSEQGTISATTAIEKGSDA